MFRILLFVITQSLCVTAVAGNQNVVDVTINKPMSQVYPAMQASFDESRFYIFYEMNIGKNLAFFAEQWGDEYNRHNIAAVRSIVFCNGWFLNKAGNKDPEVLGLCPMHITLVEKEGKTTALFIRPTVTYENSPAYDVIVKIEEEVIELMVNGMK